MADIETIAARVKDLQAYYARRDVETSQLRALRSGNWEELMPGAFNEDYPAPMVANRVDVMARDVAASLSGMPSISCSAAGGSSDSKKRFAEKRTKIANWYVGVSNLAARMHDVGDSFNAYGMAVFFVEPDFEHKHPVIRPRQGGNAYAVWDAYGNTVVGAEEWESTALTLCQQFPHLKQKFDHYQGEKSRVKVVRYADRQHTVTYLPELGDEILVQYRSPIPGECQYVMVPRPSGTGESFSSLPRGAYADLIYPQLARNEFHQLALETAYKAAQAPTIVPQDVSEVPYGPDAVIQTMNPQGVGRLPVNVPAAAFQAMQSLDEDMRIGGMSPEARTGNIDASVITGRGIEAASAGYSSQIAQAQTLIGFGLKLAIQRCFKMDEHLWPKTKRDVKGIYENVAFVDSYIPERDIKGDHSVDISFGFALGMAPNNALVFLLQATSGGLTSKEFAMRQLPMGVNPAEESKKIQLEQIQNSSIQAVAALATAVPQFVLNQQDPMPIIRALADIQKGLQKGKPIEELIVEVFAPPEPEPQQQVVDQTGAPVEGGPGGGGLSSAAERGAMLAKGPGDRPDLMQMFAGMSSSGNAVLQGGVSRMDPSAT